MPLNKLLILDLDETLIHGSGTALNVSGYPSEPDLKVGRFVVYERPHVREFMLFCRQHFKVAIWTTASADYAEPILHHICGADYPFEFIWCRDRCTPRGEGIDGEFRWIKDLKKVRKKGWDLADMLMLEDKPENLCRHYGNVIRIDPFTGNLADRELKRLMPLLLELKQVGNVRRVEKRGWKSRFNI